MYTAFRVARGKTVNNRDDALSVRTRATLSSEQSTATAPASFHPIPEVQVKTLTQPTTLPTPFIFRTKRILVDEIARHRRTLCFPKPF